MPPWTLLKRRVEFPLTHFLLSVFYFITWRVYFGSRLVKQLATHFLYSKKAGISLTRPWNFGISGSFWCVFQSSAHPPLIDFKQQRRNAETKNWRKILFQCLIQAYMPLSFYKHRIQSRLHQHKPVQTIHLRTEYLISLKTGTAISQL